MLVPADALAGAEGIGHLRLVDPERLRHLEGAREEGGALLVGEGGGLLGRQAEGVGRFVVCDIVGRGEGGQPLAQVALLEAGRGGELRRADRRSVRHRLEQAEPVAQHDERAGDAGAEVADQPADERVELLCIGCLHGSLPKFSFWGFVPCRGQGPPDKPSHLTIQ